jgi:hypothetical protein
MLSTLRVVLLVEVVVVITAVFVKNERIGITQDQMLHNNRTCRMEHLVGEWIFNPAATRSFQCCGTKKKMKAENVTEEIRSHGCRFFEGGYEICFQRGYDDNITPHSTMNGNCVCNNGHPRPPEMYTYLPIYCDLEPWVSRLLYMNNYLTSL